MRSRQGIVSRIASDKAAHQQTFDPRPTGTMFGPFLF